MARYTDVAFGHVVDGVGAVALILLGVAVLRLRPRRTLSLALGTTVVAIGVRNTLYLWNPLSRGDYADPLLWLFAFPMMLTGIAWLVGLLVVGLQWPRAAHPWFLVGFALAVGMASSFGRIGFRLEAGAGPFAVALIAVDSVAVLAAYSGFMLLAGRALKRSSTDEARRIRLVAGAWTVQSLIYGWGVWTRSTFDDAPVTFATLFAVHLVMAGNFLVSSWRTNQRVGRDLALLTTAAFATGAILQTTGPLPRGLLGVANLVMVAVFTVAIMRHRWLGVDVQLRRGVRSGSVAAIFVGAFFVGSETAQEFFGQVTGSAYIGIACAGALLLFLAPLQRMGESLSRRAVPSKAADVRLFEEAVAAAFRGRVGPREEIHLASLGQRLGLTPAEMQEARWRAATART